jgi:hypothetical protein
VIYLAVIALGELALIGLLVIERRKTNAAQIALVDRLCQRLQAPGAAIIEHDEAVRGGRDAEYAPPALDPEDDEAFWLSRERLAEAMMESERRERATAE